TQEKK
ncbi:hypothetical protein D046_3208B, partial [Vibrio parahaemolyticus V-223/04]